MPGQIPGLGILYKFACGRVSPTNDSQLEGSVTDAAAALSEGNFAIVREFFFHPQNDCAFVLSVTRTAVIQKKASQEYGKGESGGGR